MNKEILNKTVGFNNVSFRVIGVLSATFIEPQIHGLGLKTAVWLPWDFNSSKNMSTIWFSVSGNLALLGALKDNIPALQAEQKLTSLINETWQENVSDIEFYKGWQIGVTIKSIKQIMSGGSQKSIYLLIAGVIGLVIIAFINIANLFISRVAAQQQLLAIQAALGAKKNQLFNYFLMQSGLLMFASILLALFIAKLGFILIEQYLSEHLALINHLSVELFTFASAFLLLIFLFKYK